MSEESSRADAASVTLPGTVQKVIKNVYTDKPDKVEIRVEGADHLYSEIRIDNVLQNEEGENVALKVGEDVNVPLEAATHETRTKADINRTKEILNER